MVFDKVKSLCPNHFCCYSRKLYKEPFLLSHSHLTTSTFVTICLGTNMADSNRRQYKSHVGGNKESLPKCTQMKKEKRRKKQAKQPKQTQSWIDRSKWMVSSFCNESVSRQDIIPPTTSLRKVPEELKHASVIKSHQEKRLICRGTGS